MEDETMAEIKTYVPFYRKYRPQDFASLVGQEAIVQTLSNAIESNKVAHAYLLCGPRGTGKTSMARIFAKSLNCVNGPTVTPCQNCDMCLGVSNGNALDVIEFDAASNNGVEDARELIENIQFAPMAGRYKIYIIDEVHMMTSSAFNTLLKTLEEPPPNVIFIFATTEAHKVLPTIISRCQRFDFTRITVNDIVNRLKNIADTEEIKIDAEALTTIARHSRGGMRDAQGLLDQVSVLSRVQPEHVINRGDIARFTGSLEEDVLIAMTDAIAKKDSNTLLQSIGELVNRGVEPGQLIKDLSFHFRNLFLVKASINGPSKNQPEALGLPEEYFKRLQEQSAGFEIEELPQMLEVLGRIERNIRSTQQSQLWLEIGLLNLAYRQDIQLVKELSQRVEALEAQLASGITPQTQAVSTAASTLPPQSQGGFTAKQASPAPASAPPVQTTVPAIPIQQAPSPPPVVKSGSIPEWGTIINMVAHPSYKALLRDHSFLINASEDSLTIGIGSEPILTIAKKEGKLFHLQQAADQYFGRPMKLNMIFEKKPATGPAPQAGLRQTPSTPIHTANPSPVQTPIVSQETTIQSNPASAVPTTSPETPVMPQPAPTKEASSLTSFERPEQSVPGTHYPAMPPSQAPVEEAPPLMDTPTAPASQQGAEIEISEARKYTLELLQGKVID